jgi:hypothetical protein
VLRFDFVEDAKELKPDIYFVNDDAEKLEERMSLFKDAGLPEVQVVVAKRTPADGLQVFPHVRFLIRFSCAALTAYARTSSFDRSVPVPI